MGELVGGSSEYSTWGAFRTPLGVRNQSVSGLFNFSTRTVGNHSMSYDYGFKLQDNGLVTSIVNFYSPVDGYPIVAYRDEGIDGDPPPPSRLALTSTYGQFQFPQPPLNEIELDAMVGRTVTLSAGSVTLTTEAWEVPVTGFFLGQPVAPLLGQISGLAGFSPFGMFP